MDPSHPFTPNLFDVDRWNLHDTSAINDMVLFIRSFTHAIIRPNNGRNAPPTQTSTFIQFIADPRVRFVVRIAIPELWSNNDGGVLTEQNPWMWAMGCVTGLFGGGGSLGVDERRRVADVAAVVLTVLNVLQEGAGEERLGEIQAVKMVFAMRLTGQRLR